MSATVYAMDYEALVPLCDHERAGLAFDRSMAELMCHRSFFSYKDKTLNVWINHLYPPVLSTCPLYTNGGRGKERRILIGPW